MTQYGYYDTIQNERYGMLVHIDFFNSRVRLLEYEGDVLGILESLRQICEAHGFGKMLCTVAGATRKRFLTAV
jgi:hypothetical protein